MDQSQRDLVGEYENKLSHLRDEVRASVEAFLHLVIMKSSLLSCQYIEPGMSIQSIHNAYARRINYKSLVLEGVELGKCYWRGSVLLRVMVEVQLDNGIRGDPTW